MKHSSGAMSKRITQLVSVCVGCVCVCVTHLLAYAILVDGPDSWHVGGKQLILCEGGIAGPGTD